MKFRLTVLGTLLSLLLAVASVEALILDTPHNRDNGIYCYSCHSEDPATGDNHWFTANDAAAFADIDATRYNWVCNRCHTPEGTRTIDLVNPENTKFAGPVKQLHAKSTTDSTKTDWSTECVDCHDPHFQSQIEWYGDEADVIYVGLATIDTAVASVVYDANDTDGGHMGATTLGVNVSSEDIPATEWARKGKDAGFETRGVDNSRGLILVAERATPASSRTFEIVKMTLDTGTKYVMKVKGDMLYDGATAANAQELGVLYGGLLKQYIITPAGETRDVKFFNTVKVADTYGGPVDLTAGATAPVGLCQVCHTGTTWYLTSVQETVHHDADASECADCHDTLTGGAPRIDHVDVTTPILQDLNGCATDCHVNYDTAPDTAHIGSGTEAKCKTCHMIAPKVTDASTTGYVEERVLWSATNDGTTDHSADWPLDCTQCHNATKGPSLKDYTNSAEHPVVNQDTVHDTKLTAPPAFCVDKCHGTLATTATSRDVVDNVDSHGGTCNLCHITLTPSPVELKDLAEPGRTGAGCDGCHTTYFDAHDHGVMNTIDGGAAEHAITNPAACNSCHNSTATAAPDAINAPYVDAGEAHVTNGCMTCHSATDGSPIGSATGWGADWSLASGDCSTCHTTYFDSHTHVHDVSFSAAVDKTTSGTECYQCHDDAALGKGTNALGTWASILTEHETVNEQAVVPSCPTCHDYTANQSGDADTPAPATVASVIENNSNVTCITCHVVKNTDSHGSHTNTEFGWTAATRTSCGDDGRTAGGCHNDGVNDDVVLEVHGHITVYADDGKPCDLCHTDVLNNNYTRLTGTDGDATLATDRTAICTVCHTASIPNMHHDNTGTITYTPTTACATLCHNSDNSAAGDHTTLVANAGEIVDLQRSCDTCHTATIGTTDNVPVDSADDQVHDACTQCHAINATSKVVELVAPAGSVSTMNNSDGTTATDNGGGICTDCHTGYFDSHIHHDSTTTNQVAINKTDSVAPNYLDESWASAKSCGAIDCHDDMNGDGTSLDTWAGIKYEHDRSDKTPEIPSGNNVKDGDGACVNCHYHDSRSGINTEKFTGTTVAEVVAAGVATNCVDCHFAKRAPDIHGLKYRNHLDINTTGQEGVVGSYAPIALEAQCNTCHPHDTDANGGPDVILSVHKNPSCDICHTSQPKLLGDPVASAPPDFAQFANGDPFLCSECHQTTNDDGFAKPFHGMTASHTATVTRHNNLDDSDATGGYDCLVCHSEMKDAVSGTVHMEKKIARHPTCETCHTAGGTASSIISFGQESAATPAMQPCEACHDAKASYKLHGLTDATADDVHNQLLNESASSGSACASCHVAADTALARIQTHTAVAGIDCLNCHDHANATYEAVVLEGQTTDGGSNLAQNCDDCHTALGTSWYDHTDPDHTPTNLNVVLVNVATSPTREKCVDCHSQADLIAGVHDSVAPAASPNSCAECHATDSTLQGSAVGNAAGGECIVCHATYFDSHSDRTTGHALFTYDNTVDKTVAGTECASCHDDAALGATALTTWASVMTEHETVGGVAGKNSCSICHDYADNGNLSGEADTPLLADVDAAIGPDAAVTCKNCHESKTTAVHGTHDATHFEWDTDSQVTCGASACHAWVANDNPVVVGTVHSACTNCHTVAAGGDGTLIADGGRAATLSAASLQPPHADNCTVCHSGAAFFDSHLHDHAVEIEDNVTQDGTAPPTLHCVGCHDDAGAAPFVAAKTHTGCDSCHGLPLTTASGPDGTRLSDAADAGNFTPGGAKDDCADCHSAGAAYFDSHTQRGPGSSGHITALDTATQAAGGDRSQSGEQLCDDCHYDSAGVAGAGALDTWSEIIIEHETVAGSAVNGCETCHNSTRTGIDTVAFTGTTIQDVISEGSGGTAVRCLSCHYDKESPAGHGGHDAAHFDWTADSTQTCGAAVCHDAATNTDVVAQVHDGAWATGYGNTCENCHNDPTNANGGDGNTGPGPNGRGTAELVANGGPADPTTHVEECLDCHDNANFFDSHIHDHAVEIEDNVTQDGTAPPTLHCVGCHSGGGAPFVSGAGDAHGPSGCASCHGLPLTTASGPDGTRISDAADAGNFTPGGAKDDCADCHSAGAAYFDSHTQRGPGSTGHITALDTATIAAGGDRAQADEQLCNNSGCHDDAGLGASALTTWDSIITEHETVGGAAANGCETCHNSTRTGIDTVAFTGTTIQDVISEGSGGTAVRCLSCHYAKESPATHGGHDITHFPWANTGATNEPTCGGSASGCHDETLAVVGDIHNGAIATALGGKCLVCHATSAGGDGNMRAFTSGDLGDANNGVAEGGATHDVECVLCHTLSKGEIHHGHTDAVNGDCQNCHTDPRIAASQVQYQQLACRECHTKAFNSGIEIVKITLTAGNAEGATGNIPGNTTASANGTTHQFGSTAAVNNYGACFSCHGKTGKAAGLATKTVEPMHALPVQSLGLSNLGTAGVIDTNEFGGGGFGIDNTAAPNVFPQGDFQGGQPEFFGTTIWNTSYYPIGKETLNIGWSLLSHTKKASDAGDTKANNAGLITNDAWAIPAGMNFGAVKIPHDADAQHFMPHFDDNTATGSLGVDILTENTAADAVYSLKAGGTGPIEGTRTITVDVSSDDATATLSVIYGGRVLWTGTANGQAAATIDLFAEATALLGAGNEVSVYASGGTGVIFVVSDKGGSIKLRTATNPGQAVN